MHEHDDHSPHISHWHSTDEDHGWTHWPVSPTIPLTFYRWRSWLNKLTSLPNYSTDILQMKVMVEHTDQSPQSFHWHSTDGSHGWTHRPVSPTIPLIFYRWKSWLNTPTSLPNHSTDILQTKDMYSVSFHPNTDGVYLWIILVNGFFSFCLFILA